MRWLLEDQRTLARHYTKNAIVRTHPQQFLLLLKDCSTPNIEKESEEVSSPVDSGVADSDEGSEGGGGGRFEDCELSKAGEGLARKRVWWQAPPPSPPPRLPLESSHAPSVVPPPIPPLPASEALHHTSGGWRKRRPGLDSKAGLLRRFLRSLPDVRRKDRGSVWNLPAAPQAPPAHQALPEVDLALALPPPNPPPPALTNLLCSETIHGVYKVADMEGEALLCVLTERKLFIMGALGDGTIKKCLDYRDLRATIVGPGEELVVIGGRSGWEVAVGVAGRRGCQLCCRLHWAVSAAAPNLPPPAALLLSLPDMAALSSLVSSHTKHKDFEMSGYIWALVDQRGGREGGGRKEGEVMLAVGPRGKWTAGRVSVGEGAVRVETAGGETRGWPAGGLAGCRRVATSRPHTFLASFGSPSDSLVVAAPDDYEAASWMEALLAAASPPPSPPSGPALLLLTPSFLLASPYPHKALSASTPLDAIAVVHTGPTTCILELGCGEAREGGQSDWGLTFLCQESLREFVSLLLRHCPTIAQRQLDGGSSCLELAWERLTLSYQI